MQRKKNKKQRGSFLAFLTALLLLSGFFTSCGLISEPDTKWDIKEHTQFRKEEYLKEHYQKHVIEQGEFEEYGEVSIQDYLIMAQKLVDEPNEDVLIKEEEDGDLLYYDPQSNGFAVLSADGYLRTYFRPSDGMEYFNRK